MKSNEFKTVNSKIRLASMFMDHAFMTAVLVVFLIPAIYVMIDSSGLNADVDLFANNTIYFGAIGFALYFCKDVYNGQSLSKRIFKLVVIDNITGKVATPMKCFLRNLTCFIWPIEVIVTLKNPERRLGDKIAGTRIEYFDKENIEKPKKNIQSLIVVFAIAYLFALVGFYLWNQLVSTL